MIPPDLEDHIQALAFTGFNSLPHTTLLRVTGVNTAWLAHVLPKISFGRARQETGVQLLLTAAGLAALGASPEQIRAMGREFANGITSTPTSQRLGDSGPHAPDTTWWTDRDHQAVLLFYGTSAEALAAPIAELTSGVRQVGQTQLRLPPHSREPFGFLDGITRTRIARGNADKGYAMPAGTFIFGLPDASGSIADGGPMARHGALVVLRELSQDVQSFWRYWLQVADGDETTAIRLAAKAVGRWPNGMPLLPGQVTEPAFDATQLDFGTFAHDPKGDGCPFGSHVRRANPREGLTESPEISLQIAALHTILRRGRVFGPAAPPDWYPTPLRMHMADGTQSDAAAHRGLMFIGLCRDLRSQFEFIVQNWLLAPKFADLYNEVDPLLAHTGTQRSFTVPTGGFCKHLEGVGGWIRPHGGGYYLMPGREVLRQLALSANPRT